MRVWTPIITIIAITTITSGTVSKPEEIDSLNLQHKELVVKAEASVAGTAVKAQKDPLRPIYHLTTAANWINDPDGPVFFKGQYHIFFQHNPYGDSWGNMSWGHAVSSDLAHWRHLPIALVPSPGSYDKDGVWSGCCVVDEGVPTIIYTGVHPEVQCIARSYDGMKSWVKYSGNPVLPIRPRDDLQGFRDPFVWKEKDGWYMVLGSGIKGQGGAALLYRSKDLTEWEYMHPLCVDFGENWECPNFFPLGDKYVLVVSPHSDVKYSVGTYKDHKFTTGPWRLMDMGGRENFYAPNCLENNKGKRIMWGWIQGGGTKGYPWNGVLTLPRVLTLRPDDRLGMQPAPELKKLRGKQYSYICTGNIPFTEDSPNILKDIKGDCLEIIVEFEPLDAKSFGLEVFCSPDGKEKTSIGYDLAAKRLFSGDKGGSFELLKGEKRLRLNVFLDKSVVEVYANERECITTRVCPRQPDSQGLNLFVKGGTVRLVLMEVWEMKSIW